MDRRAFVGGAAAAMATGRARGADAQLRRIVRLSPLSRDAERPMMDGLLAGLRDLGWTEGRNFSLESRFADGDGDRLSDLAAEAAALRPDLIIAGSNPGALAAKKATAEIPVVFVTTGDPVSGGLVTNLNRPEANLTGVTALGAELAPKRLELLKDAFGGSRIAVLTNPGAPYTEEFVALRPELERKLSTELSVLRVSHPADLQSRIETLPPQVASLLVLTDIMFFTNRQAVIDAVSKRRVPAMYPDRAFVDSGGLLFYGSALPKMYRHAAIHVDKILRGARPSDLPIEQPTVFELVVNMRTAKAQGIAIPPSLAGRADEVIE